MSFGNTENSFFVEASSLIYRWLSEEERIQLNGELRSEEIRNIEELRPQLRLFRLLHFILIKFVRVEKWTMGISKLLKDINAVKPNMPIEDLIFKDANEMDVSFLELRNMLKESTPQTIFSEFLRQAGLEGQFREYIKTLPARRQEW